MMTVLEKAMKGHVPMDSIQNAMGVMGPWNIVIAVALSLIKLPLAWHHLSITLLAPPIDFSCASPQPATNESVMMKCYIDVGNGTLEKCNDFKYDKRQFRETIVTQWDLVCDKEQLANLVQSCIMFGILIGNLVFSMISDRIGRKQPLMIAIILQSVAGVLSAFAPWYELFLLLKFIAALATGGIMIVSFVLLMEIIGIEWRSTMSVMFHFPFQFGQLLSPLISYLTHTWYGFQLAISIPSIFLLSYYWIIPESPRWLLAVGKLREAEVILTKAAEKNKIPVENVKTVMELYENQARIRQIKKKKYNITHLFRSPNLRMKSICILTNWFVCGISLFGLIQYMSYLDGNIFINVTISALAQLPGLIIVLFLITRVSRLRILMAGNFLAAFTLFLIIIVQNPIGQKSLAALGVTGMAIGFPAIYLYSSEAFPTVVRNIGIGMGSISARLGSMIAPYIATAGNVKPWLPPLLFGLGPLIAGCLCYVLPETMDCELPETVEDSENFGKKTST